MKSLLFASLVAILLAVAVSGKTLPDSPLPRGWEVDPKNSAKDLQAIQRMTINLKRKNMNKLEEKLWELSSPSSDKFGDRLSAEEIRDIVTPGPAAVSRVGTWLKVNGIEEYEVSRHEDSIAFDATAATIEKLLSVRFESFVHAKTKQTAFRAVEGMTIPDEVASLITLISGHRGFPVPDFKPHGAKQAGQGMSINITPAKIYSSYNMSYFPTTPSGKTNIQSFFQAQGQYVDPKDLSTFCKDLTDLKDCKITKYIGPNQGTTPGVESSLDSEYITATGRATETWVWSYSNFDFCGDLMRWGHDVRSRKTYPWVISMSYGSQSLPNFCLGPDVEALSKEIMMMGTMGISVIIASGDSGSAENSRMGYNYGLLAPSMPASIPWCTAVGATGFVSGNSGEEAATTQFGSGGGFSFDYARPSYQDDAVKAFFKADYKLPPHLSYNASGRGTPDVAAFGEGVQVISGGVWEPVGGTSCSTPTFAGMVTMLNNIRLENGKTMGFLNPFLYSHPETFTDIVKGNNDVSGDGMGWYCTKGWDPATGLGTPNWGLMADAVKAINARERKQ